MEYIQKEDRVEIQMPENIPNDLYGKYSIWFIWTIFQMTKMENIPIPNGNIEQIFSLHASALKSLERNHLGNHLNIARSSVLIQGWMCVPNKILLTMPEVVSKSVTKAEFLEVGCPGGWKVEGGQRQHHQERHHQQHQHQVGCLLRFKEGIFLFFYS